jgi:hypothetical protein
MIKSSKISLFLSINSYEINILKLKLLTVGEERPSSLKGYALIGAYLSSNNNTNNEFESDLGILDSTYSRALREGFKPIIGGDLNADSERLKYQNDKILKGWLQKMEYLELSRIYTQRVPNTFLSSRGQYSNIDHFVINQRIPWPEIEQVNIRATEKEASTMRTPEWKEAIKRCWDWEKNMGDHRAVVLNLVIQVSKQHWEEKCVKMKKQKINWKNERHKKTYAEQLQEELRRSKELTKQNLDLEEATASIAKLELVMKEATMQTLNKIFGKSKKERKYKKSKNWWNKDLKILIKGRSFTSTRLYELEGRLKRGYESPKKRAAIKKKLRFYSLARNLISKKFKKQSKKSKKLIKKIEREKMIDNFFRNPELFWKQVTSKRGARVEVDIKLEDLVQAYEKNFTTVDKTLESELLEKKMQGIVTKYSNLVKSKRSRFKVEKKIIYDILHNLKNNKTGGLNGITNEMYKYGRDTDLTCIIANLFKSIIRGGYFPNNLNIGLICTIIKDPTLSNQTIDNTRPITLSEVLSVVLENFILFHLTGKDILHKHQFGFRKHSSCMHAVYSIKEIMEDVKLKRTNAYAIYLDFSKAFDKVNRTKLLCMLIRDADPDIWLLIKSYYENLILHVKDNSGKISPGFNATVGVKQGGNMSPWLFNRYINDLIIKLEKSNKTYNINGMSKGVMVYADDTNVISHNLVDLYECIFIIERYCMLYDITINAKKTKWMLLGEPKSIVAEEVLLKGAVLEKVESFKFLGVIINSNGSYLEHLARRRSLFMTGISEVHKLGFTRRDVPVRMKKLLYTSLVRSKLTYGIETIKINKTKLKKYLGGLESQCLKNACGVNTRSKSTSLIYGMGITPISLYIYKRKISFILQLLQNTATSELISHGVHETLSDIIESLGISKKDLNRGAEQYHVILKNTCKRKLAEIAQKESLICNSLFF